MSARLGSRAWPRPSGVLGAVAMAMAVAALLLAGACGIPPDHRAALAAPGSVPFDLLRPESVTPATAPASVTAVRTAIFLVQGERLAAVYRELAAPINVQSVLAALAAGPTGLEVQLGLRTAILDPSLMRSAGVTGGIATVDLGPSFSEIAGRDQILALAQIVSTVTSLPGVGRVSFTLQGSPLAILRGDGSATTDSVSKDDYANLAPSPAG